MPKGAVAVSSGGMVGRSGPLTLQGIVVPQAAVDPDTFFRLTRGQRLQTKQNVPWQGNGAVDIIEIPQVGILAEMTLTVKGTITVTTAAATPSYRWPYDLVKSVRFSANGQSNLISCSGGKLKLREMAATGVANDRGVQQNIGGTVRSNGTLSNENETWGVSPGVSAAVATYNFELSYEIPVAWEKQFLTGAIFAQTSSTQLQLQIEWNTAAALFSVNPANVAFSAVTYTLESEVYPVPYDGGVAIVPDLSTFHFLTQITDQKLAVGESEFRVMGQGIGKQLMRIYFQVWNNGINAQPLPLLTANFASIAWRYGGSEQPQKWAGGTLLGAENERNYGSAPGKYWGYGVIDFSSKNAFRDSVDEGLASELRFMLEIASGTTISGPAVEYVREEMMAAPVGV